MIRAVVAADMALVHDSWLKSYASSDYARLVTPEETWRANKGHGGTTYKEGQAALIAQLVATNVVLVDEAPDGLVDGWACGWPKTTLHYVYVRQIARGKRVARRLLDALHLREGERVRYSHRARGIRGNPRGWTFDPTCALVRKESTMAKTRIRYIKFNVDIPFRSHQGAREMKGYLREEDRFTAEFDDATRLIVLHTEDFERAAGKWVPMARFIPVEQVQFFELYAKGEKPAWERERDEKAGAAA